MDIIPFQRWEDVPAYLDAEQRADPLSVLEAFCEEISCTLIGYGYLLICIGEQFFEFEQDNRPDYLGYHLNDDFESWFTSQQQKISRTGIESFSLSTDGIFTFKEFNTGIYDKPDNIIDFLLVNEEGSDNSNMLNSKMIEIKTTWGLKPTDDLAIIKVIMNR